MDETQVQRTASDAARAKTSMSRAGYYSDNFIKSFLGAAGGARCPPLINRGYYARFKCIDTLVRAFVQRCAAAGKASQVVVFGGGSDTMYFRYLEEARAAAAAAAATATADSADKGSTSATSDSTGATDSSAAAPQPPQHHSPVPTRFVELDLPENSVHKAVTIMRKPELARLLGITGGGGGGASASCRAAAGASAEWPRPPQAAVATVAAGVPAITSSGVVVEPRKGILRTTAGYSVRPCDLRDPAALDGIVTPCGLDTDAPTLFLSECVLIYMEPQHADAAIQWAASTFSNAAFVTYEQIGPDDPFGRMMVQNLRKRGCALRTIHAYPTLESQVERYRGLGFDLQVLAKDMNFVYDRCIDPVDRRRIEKLELFDEFEEWRLIQGHYCLVVALKQQQLQTAQSSAAATATAATVAPTHVNDTADVADAGQAADSPADVPSAAAAAAGVVASSPGLCGFADVVTAFFSPPPVAAARRAAPAPKLPRAASPMPGPR